MLAERIIGNIFFVEILIIFVFIFRLSRLSNQIDAMINKKGLPLAGLYTAARSTSRFSSFRLNPYDLDDDYSDKEILLLSRKYDRSIRKFYIAFCFILLTGLISLIILGYFSQRQSA